MKAVLHLFAAGTAVLGCGFALWTKPAYASPRHNPPIIVAPDGPQGPQFEGYPVTVERPYYSSYARPYFEPSDVRSDRPVVCEGGGWVWTGGWGLLDCGWGYYPPTPDYVYVPNRCYR